MVILNISVIFQAKEIDLAIPNYHSICLQLSENVCICYGNFSKNVAINSQIYPKREKNAQKLDDKSHLLHIGFWGKLRTIKCIYLVLFWLLHQLGTVYSKKKLKELQASDLKKLMPHTCPVPDTPVPDTFTTICQFKIAYWCFTSNFLCFLLSVYIHMKHIKKVACYFWHFMSNGCPVSDTLKKVTAIISVDLFLLKCSILIILFTVFIHKVHVLAQLLGQKWLCFVFSLCKIICFSVLSRTWQGNGDIGTWQNIFFQW